MPRHRHTLLLPLALALALLFAAGCGDDPTEPSPNDSNATGTMQAEFSATGGGFEIDTNPSGDPNHPMPGPFRIRGSNVHYDDELGALVVDLTIENRSQRHLPYPVLMTFLGLFPEGVTVLNADNGETGPGAQIEFQFAQDDLTWDPGEVSLPRTVQFGVEPATAIGFVARIDVGLDPTAGAIGGVVYHDRNENGMMDTDEEGIGGAVLTLAGPRDLQLRTRSLRDGSYRFENLPAGAYTVRKLAMDGTKPTTPTELVVVLPETEDGVADFLSANFGCIRLVPPPNHLVLRPGDILKVKGRYQPDPHRIMALAIEVQRPGPDEFPSLHATLAGPVTDLHRERRAVAIAGTWVVVGERDDATLAVSDDDCDLEHLELRDRVVARDIHLMRGTPDDTVHLFTRDLGCWEREVDYVEGIADEVQPAHDAAGRVLLRVRVLNTWVVVTSETEIRFAGSDPEPPLSGLDGVIRSLVRSYEERHLAEFEGVLAEGFTFSFAAADVEGGAPASWDRQREVAAATRMFSGEPGHGPDGATLAPVQSIDVELMPLDAMWREADGEFAGTWTRRFAARVHVDLADGMRIVASGLQEFYVAPRATPEAVTYRLASWRDLGPATVNVADESVSWGRLKRMFGN